MLMHCAERYFEYIDICEMIQKAKRKGGSFEDRGLLLYAKIELDNISKKE